MKYPGNITSKLPNMGTSIFAVMSQMANEHHAINLAQGFPDFEISGLLIDKVHHFMKKGYNQYAPMPGVPALRNVISRNVKERYGITYDPDREITITAGATQAIFTAISAMIKDEDEVIIIEPAYDSYAPSVRLNGGMVKYATLAPPDFQIDWDQLVRLITHRTKLIIINTPHNPTGSILSEEDLKQFERIVTTRDLMLLSDEVYEHLIYDNKVHQSVCRYPKLAQRSFVIGSFGKTVHATGWKTGYVLAPENLMKEFRKAHQYVVFASNTPVQHAIAEFMEDPGNYVKLGRFYQEKRDYFENLLKDSRFTVLPSYGTYFQCVDYSEISDEADFDFAERLTKEHGVAAIPLSPFYQKENGIKLLRFCFAKKEETLREAAEILCKI
jgi:methionine aminotransferase